MRARRLPGIFLLLVVLCGACAPGASQTARPGPSTRSPGTLPPPTAVPAPTPPQVTPRSGQCPGYPPGSRLINGTALYPEPALPEPLPRQWFGDPTFGTCLVRVTDRCNDPAPGDPSPGLVNEYSRVQSFNADESRLLVRGTEGSWYLYDARSLQPLGELPLQVEPRWDGTDPNVIYYGDGTQLYSFDVQAMSPALVHDFADDFPGQTLAAVWTRYEGRPSRDSRYWGLMAEDEDWETVAFVVYDRQLDRAVTRDVRGLPGVLDGIDHVTISPLGHYFLASFDLACPPGELGSDARPCGLMVYDADLANGRGLLRIIGHYDVALDASGNEVIAYQDIDTDDIAMLDLASGATTPLWSIDFSHTAIGLHFSGLAYDRPGWAVVSTYDDTPGTFTWMDDQVLLVELEAGGQVLRLAHTHSLRGEEDYWAEPHASVNPSLTRVLFSSNWGRLGGDEVELFMIALPPGWPELLP